MLEVGYYIQFLAFNGRPLSVRYYQNFFIGETRPLNGNSYQFAPFSISGDLSTEGANSGQAELIAPANILSGAILWESIERRYLLQIRTVLLTGIPPTTLNGLPTWTEAGTLSCDVRVCDGLSYTDAVPGESDSAAVFALRLQSPLNTVTGISPTRRLRDDQVGALPSSGGITF